MREVVGGRYRRRTRDAANDGNLDVSTWVPGEFVPSDSRSRCFRSDRVVGFRYIPKLVGKDRWTQRLQIRWPCGTLLSRARGWGRQDRAISPSGFGGSDEAAHDWMPVKVTQAGNGAPGRIIRTLQDLIGWYLDALALGLDPVETGSVRLVIGGLTISLRRATEGFDGIQWSFDPRHLKASEPIGKLVSWLMSRRPRRQQNHYASQ